LRNQVPWNMRYTVQAPWKKRPWKIRYEVLQLPD
jgi:hypothetical protein